jgi:hypothetical protein
MIVMDEDDCMVSVAKFFLEFTVGESCGPRRLDGIVRDRGHGRHGS